MTQKEKKEKLLNFIETKAFNPILKKSEDDFSSDSKKKKFKDVKRSTENEKERFRNYNSPEDIRDNYLSDLSSHTAKKKNAELKELGLPRLPDFKEEFLELCGKLDVK